MSSCREIAGFAVVFHDEIVKINLRLFDCVICCYFLFNRNLGHCFVNRIYYLNSSQKRRCFNVPSALCNVSKTNHPNFTCDYRRQALEKTPLVDNMSLT